MAAGPFRMIVRQAIKPGKLEEFKKMSESLTSGVEADEPTTLGYEWFIDEAGSSCYLIESYGDPESFLLHFQGLGDKLGAMLEISPLEDMVVIGDPGPEVKEMLAGLGAKFYSAHVGFALAARESRRDSGRAPGPAPVGPTPDPSAQRLSVRV